MSIFRYVSVVKSTSLGKVLRPIVRTGDLADVKVGVALCCLFAVAALIFFILAVRAFKEWGRNRY